MLSLRNLIIEVLQENNEDLKALTQRFEQIVKDHGDEAYQTLLHILTHLNISSKDSKKYWAEILEHHKSLCTELKREVTLSTATCDYFCSINKTLRTPMVVEIHIFENKEAASKYDKLTGLYNRCFFDETVQKEISRARRYKYDLSLIFFDLDDFKSINDTFGHMFGDEVLKRTAKTILEEIRNEDIAARFGGEELLVILPHTSKFQALVLADRIRETIGEEEFSYEDKKVRVTVSGGVSSYPGDTTNVESLMQNADKALYDAKRAGKNAVVAYSPDRRKYFRVDFDKEVKLVDRVDGKEIEDVKAKGKNISKVGMLFESDRIFEIGKKIELQFMLDSLQTPLMIAGTVTRVDIFKMNRFDIGISFLDMGKDVQSKLSKYFIVSSPNIL